MIEEFKLKKLVSVRDVAKLLGLSERWVYNRIGEGSLPVVKLKGATRISLAILWQLCRWLPHEAHRGASHRQGHRFPG